MTVISNPLNVDIKLALKITINEATAKPVPAINLGEITKIIPEDETTTEDVPDIAVNETVIELIPDCIDGMTIESISNTLVTETLQGIL